MGNILGWLINLLTGPLKDVVKWVNEAFNAVTSWVSSLWDFLGREIVGLWQGFVVFEGQIGAFAVSVYKLAIWIWQVAIPDVEKWVIGIWDDLKGYAEGIWTQLSSLYNSLLKYVDYMFNGVFKWITDNIWDPLYNDIAGAINWITHDGYFLYQLITQPDKLAAWIGKWLLASWIGLLKNYSKPIARWLLHSMMSLEGELVTIMEDFIANLL